MQIENKDGRWTKDALEAHAEIRIQLEKIFNQMKVKGWSGGDIQALIADAAHDAWLADAAHDAWLDD